MFPLMSTLSIQLDSNKKGIYAITFVVLVISLQAFCEQTTSFLLVHEAKLKMFSGEDRVFL